MQKYLVWFLDNEKPFEQVHLGEYLLFVHFSSYIFGTVCCFTFRFVPVINRLVIEKLGGALVYSNLYILLAHLSTKCSSELLWSFNVRRPSSVVRASVRASVNNLFKQHLLWNRLLDFDQTSQEWSLGGPLSKLFKPFQLVA